MTKDASITDKNIRGRIRHYLNEIEVIRQRPIVTQLSELMAYLKQDLRTTD